MKTWFIKFINFIKLLQFRRIWIIKMSSAFFVSANKELLKTSDKIGRKSGWDSSEKDWY